MRVLVDYHHSSLLRSLTLLGDRLGVEIMRPIGMEWWHEDLWAVWPAEDTARQYLGLGEQAFVPTDGTPCLNETLPRDRFDVMVAERTEPVRTFVDPPDGVYRVYDPGRTSSHLACTLDWFREHDFELLICSLPQHLPIFDRLAEHQRARGVDCQVVMQVGNEWDLTPYVGRKLLASLRPRPLPGVDVCWYHQEFEADTLFAHDEPSPWPEWDDPELRVTCFMNVLREQNPGARVFDTLEAAAPDFRWLSYGGQCRDGCMTGHAEMAQALRSTMAVLHPKLAEGYGHVIYNTFAVGRPVLVFRDALRPFLCDELLQPGTFIDLNSGPDACVAELRRLAADPDALAEASHRCRAAFDAAVDFTAEAERIAAWLGLPAPTTKERTQ